MKIPNYVMHPTEYDCYCPIDSFKGDLNESKAAVEAELKAIAGDIQRIYLIAAYLGVKEHFVSSSDT